MNTLNGSDVKLVRSTLKGTEMGKKSRKFGRLVARLAARYGDDDEDVVRLRMELAVLEAAEAIREEPHVPTPKSLPSKVTARTLYLKSVSIDNVHRFDAQGHSP